MTLEDCLITYSISPISGGWIIGTYFFLDMNHALWKPRFFGMVEFTGNAHFSPEIPWVLDIEKGDLASLIEESIHL